jgi:hypothetical protein
MLKIYSINVLILWQNKMSKWPYVAEPDDETALTTCGKNTA